MLSAPPPVAVEVAICPTPSAAALGVTGACRGSEPVLQKHTQHGGLEAVLLPPAPSVCAPRLTPSRLPVRPLGCALGGGEFLPHELSPRPPLLPPGIPVPPTHTCDFSGPQRGLSPPSACLSHWIPPAQPPKSPHPTAEQVTLPPVIPTLCLPLAPPAVPLGSFPQGHPGSSVLLRLPQEALPGCTGSASTPRAAYPACSRLSILCPWAPSQSALATPQAPELRQNRPLSPGHPLRSDPSSAGPLSPPSQGCAKPPFPHTLDPPQSSVATSSPLFLCPRPLRPGWVGAGQSRLGEGRCGLLPASEGGPC